MPMAATARGKADTDDDEDDRGGHGDHAHRDTTQHGGGWSGFRLLGDALDGVELLGGVELRSLAESPTDDQPTDDGHGDGPRLLVVSVENPIRGRNGADDREAHGDVGAAVERCTQGVGFGGVASADEERADDRGHHADEGDGQRVHEEPDVFCETCLGRGQTSTCGERDERDRSNDRSGVGLEEVGSHAGHVAHVVAHVVGDGGRVARVVLGDPGFDLADEVGSDVGGLGVDATTDAGEERNRRCAETEGRDDFEGIVDFEPCDEHQVRRGEAEQCKPGHGEAHDGATAEGDGECLCGSGLGGLGGASVGHGGHGHADVSGE
jgi:hypothetical protein